MNREDIFNGITEIYDQTIEAAKAHRLKKRPLWKRPTPYIALAAAIALMVTAAFIPGGIYTKNVTVLAQAQYPEMAQYPDNHSTKKYDAWLADQKKQTEQYDGYTDGLDEFFEKSIPVFLQCDDNENMAYSPLNLYMALGMLSEVTDGNSRQQILDLLGAEDMASLRRQAKAVWNANYCDDGRTSSLLANSLWLNNKYTFNQTILDSLADNYYATSFSGKMGSNAVNKQLRRWLNEQTGDFLSDRIAGVELKKQTLIALASTVYFKDSWYEEFNKNNTYEDTFHASHKDITCEFMKDSLEIGAELYSRTNFSAVSKRFVGGNEMWFILPNEGVEVKQLLSDTEALEFISSPKERQSEASGAETLEQMNQYFQQYKVINLYLPKFDISTETDLISGMKSIGITDVFDPSAADFSSLIKSGSKDSGTPYLGSADHAVRVKVDEEGCEAASYVVMQIPGGVMDPSQFEEIDFVLDRPFIFAITGTDGVPMFVGVINDPNK